MSRVIFNNYPDVYEPAARLASINAVYPFGQVVYESDTQKFKVSDGKTAYNSLSYGYGNTSAGEASSLYNKSYFPDLTDFETNGSNFSTSSGAIQAAADTTYNKYLRVKNYVTASPRYSVKVQHAIQSTAAANNTYGIAISIESINSTVQSNIFAYLTFSPSSADTRKVLIRDVRTSNTVFSTPMPAYDLLDLIETIVTKEENVWTVTANNLTKGTSVSASYTDTLTHGAPTMNHNTAKIGIVNVGDGVSRITHFSISSPIIPGMDRVTIGDSITVGSFAGNLANTYSKLIGAVPFGGGGDKTVEVYMRLDEIKRFKPKKAFLMIGINDVGNAIGNWQTNYRTIVKILEDAGIPVVKLASTPTNAYNMSVVKDFLATNYPTSYIDTYTPLLGTGTALNAAYNAGDGTHLNAAGNLVIANTIKASSLYI